MKKGSIERVSWVNVCQTTQRRVNKKITFAEGAPLLQRLEKEEGRRVERKGRERSGTNRDLNPQRGGKVNPKKCPRETVRFAKEA